MQPDQSNIRSPQSAVGTPIPPEAELRLHVFLSTDVVGSTAMHRRHPDDMLDTMDQHDRLLHGAIRRHGGDPFKHTGDGVTARFDRALDAIHAAIEAQRDMRAAQWSATGRPEIRWAIHRGLARPRGDDFFGPAMPMLNRLEGAANADQIIVSQEAAARLTGAGEPDTFSLKELGEHHFKGVESVQVFQVQAPELPQDFPPLGGKRETVNGNLPADLSSFLGRETELRELRELFERTRVLTLLGPGGIGKTRLATEFARSKQPDFPDGVWMVELSSVEPGTDPWPFLARTFEIEPVPGADRRLQVLDRLRDARALLLLDNCEHVLDETADIVMELGAGCEGLSIVNTSRHTLGVTGETIYRVPPLGEAKPDNVQQSAAVQLFVERARQTNHRFEATPEDLQTIEKICENLEHIPLAIEIAAGQLRRLTLSKLVESSASPLDLTATSRHRRNGRQQTLRRTLDRSYELLDPFSREILQRLSIFSGSFHETQAIAVCALGGEDEMEILDGIDELIDSSLLTPSLEEDKSLGMLRTVLTFGREKLAEAGMTEQVSHRHGEVYAQRSLELGQQFGSEEEKDAVAAILDEMPNLRSAFERALDSDLSLAARLTTPLFLYNYLHRGADTVEWPARIMKRSGAEDLPQAPLLLAAAAGHALHEEGDPVQAKEFITRAMVAENNGGESSRGWVHHVAGQIAFWSGDPKLFFDHHEKALNDAREANDLACEVVDVSMAAFVKSRSGDVEGAKKLIDALGEIEASAKQPSLIGYIHFARGGLASRTDIGLAVEEMERAIEWAEIGGNTLGVRRVRQIIADLSAEKIDYNRALGLQIRALKSLPAHGATIYVWAAIKRLLVPLSALEADEELAIIAGALQSSSLHLGSGMQKRIDTSRERLGDEKFKQAIARGKQLDQKAARLFALNALENLDRN